MSSNSKLQKSGDITNLNKKILEIKKKIQLAEGQRKALFEECETERKSNADEILKLKKDISHLLLRLKDSRSLSAKSRIKTGQLESVVGVLGERNCFRTQNTLDLLVTDKNKKLDLICYKTKQREKRLTELANEYQTLVSEKDKKEMVKKIEYPVSRATTDMENNIHAVNIQWREAQHIHNRLKDIKSSLQKDASQFDYRVQCTEYQLRIQQTDIARLQKIGTEASKLRISARNALMHEEKSAMHAARMRDNKEGDGKRMVGEGKQQLEKLERRIFQSGKVLVRADADEGLEGFLPNITVTSATSKTSYQIRDVFDKLKQITGSTTTEEVVERFRTQRDTDTRLTTVRNDTEAEKKKLEKLHDSFTRELEGYKYAEAKSAELNLDEVERIRSLIKEQEKFGLELAKTYDQNMEIVETVCNNLRLLDTSLQNKPVVENDPHLILGNVSKTLVKLVNDYEQRLFEDDEVKQMELLDVNEERWLPPPYNGLVRASPVRQESPESPMRQTTPGSEEEEDVPTRGFLKRQAELVVDTKARRKTMRAPLPKVK